MNPIKQGVRDVLVAVANGHSSSDAISKATGIYRATVVSRLRQLKDASMVSAFNNSYQVTDKGNETIKHAPVIKPGQQVTAFSHAHPGKASVQKYEVYMPIELKRPPGVTVDRFEAFSLPSRRGNWLHYPDGRTEKV
jgi:hypothetical protein